ncbi:MAG: hypothetical protein CMJ29_08810 [Phycisphaerae bacterium]|nr:hypothetical protein [Phycisphaerae bacterium]
MVVSPGGQSVILPVPEHRWGWFASGLRGRLSKSVSKSCYSGEMTKFFDAAPPRGHEGTSGICELK